MLLQAEGELLRSPCATVAQGLRLEMRRATSSSGQYGRGPMPGSYLIGYWTRARRSPPRGAWQVWCSVSTSRAIRRTGESSRGGFAQSSRVVMQRPDEPCYNRPEVYLIDDWQHIRGPSWNQQPRVGVATARVHLENAVQQICPLHGRPRLLVLLGPLCRRSKWWVLERAQHAER